MNLSILRMFAILTACSVTYSVVGQHNPGASRTRNKTLIVFFDGLRPDYITAAQMPNLFAFKNDACYGSQHHSVFPTVTRVNSSSYATGSYPGTHGILGNSVFFPEVSRSKATGTSYGDLSKVSKAIQGPLLTAVSLGEVLKNAGEKMMVFSSGTTGQAFLQNPTVNGAIINPDLILPETLKDEVTKAIGPPPAENEAHDQARHQWITDGLLQLGLQKNGPLVSAIWFSDPDGAAHSHGIGSAQAVSAIRFVDAQFGRIMDEIKKRNLDNELNIIISTDHGFVTHIGKINLADFLIEGGFKKSKESEDVVVAEGAIYVKDHNEEMIKNIVASLHQQKWVGAIFTKAKTEGGDLGWVDGTLSFDAVHYNHARAGDILVAMDWNDAKNEKGFAGTDYSGGVAGHGGSSPYEINIALFAKGPDFRKSFAGTLPTSNVDIAPTILSMYGLPIPSKMDGRAVTEFLIGSKTGKQSVQKQTVKTSAKYPWGTYNLLLERSVLGAYKYVDFTRVARQIKP